MKLDIEFNSGAQLPMDAIPALARAAEDSGFDCAWGGEANNKDPTVMLAAVGAVTTRLKLGTAVYHMLGRTPVSMALHAAGLDELSGGRFLFGLGISNPTIANWHGVEFDHPLGAYGSIWRSSGAPSGVTSWTTRAGSTRPGVSSWRSSHRAKACPSTWRPSGRR